MLNISGYIITAALPDGENALLLHGYTGALDKVAAPVAHYLSRHRGQRYDAEVLDDETAVARLAARGYLTEKTLDEERALVVEIAAALHGHDLISRRPGFVVIPSYACNLRCPYCFQPHDMHAKDGPKSRVMSESQIDDVLNIIERFDSPGSVASTLGRGKPDRALVSSKPSSITLFGGEPLSALTLESVRHLVARARSAGHPLRAISNGVQLNLFEGLIGPGYIEDLQITLDGLADLHNRRRVGPEFKNTFDIVSRNIGMALERGARVNVRLNIDQANISQLEDLHGYFENLGWNSASNFYAAAAVVHSSTPWVTDGSLVQLKKRKTDISEPVLVAETLRLKAKAGSRIESYEPRAAKVLETILFGGGYPFDSVSYCGAVSGQLIFDPLGDVYTCWEDVGHQELRIGQYAATDLSFDTKQALAWTARFPGAIDECSRCQYALIHKSGCGNHARQRTGGLNESHCEGFQDYFPQVLGRLYAELEARALAPAVERDEFSTASVQL